MIAIQCLTCKCVLGQTDGKKLFLGAEILACYLTRGTTLYCALCKSKRYWQPTPILIDILCSTHYTNPMPA